MRGGVFSSGAGRGEDENPHGGAKKRANQWIKIFYKSVYVVIEIFMHYVLLIRKNSTSFKRYFCKEDCVIHNVYTKSSEKTKTKFFGIMKRGIKS